MTTSSTPRSCRNSMLMTLVAVLSAISLSCNALSGLLPIAGEEAGEQGAGQGAAPPEAGEAPTVLGFVLDPDGAPVAFASVAGEIADRSGTVSGDLTGSASGWLEVRSLGYATGYVKPGEAIGETAFFEARLTPFGSFQPLESGGEVVQRLGDAAAPVGEISLSGDDVSTLPAYLETAVYDLLDVGPYPAEPDSGEALELKLAIAIEASSDQLEPVPLASGKTIALKLFPNASLPADPVMAIFDAEGGVWEIQPNTCESGEEDALLCTVPRFSPLLGFFGPREEASLMPGAAKHLLLPFADSEDQAYQVAMIEAKNWIERGQWEVEATGMVSPEWEAGMTSRLVTLADAAEAYAAAHPERSGISRLLAAADLAIATGNQPIADELIEEAKATAEKAADELLKESDCGRVREMANMFDLLTSLGSLDKAAAMQQKLDNMGECDQWYGTINIDFKIASSPPRLDYAMESGGGKWSENHSVEMTTNVSTFVLKGEDMVKLDFGQVQYGEYDRHGCHTYHTHAGEGGGLVLKFDGRYDGHTFTVGDLQPEGGTASITWGVHGETWDSEAEKCRVIGDQTVPAPNYTTVLSHGFMGSPPITMQEILDQGGSNDSFSGGEEISNSAFELGIFPSEGGNVRWHFWHTQKYLPVKE